METPTITASEYTTSCVDASSFLHDFAQQNRNGIGAELFRAAAASPTQVQPPKKESTVSNARIVKVFIADSNDNLPLDKRVLYSGDEKLTDLTDQELFFEVPIAEMLAKHNEVRKTTVDKKQAEKFGRDIYLEPARIRDLKMVVVTVAQF